MYTALVSPEYAERNAQAITVAGGFIARGLAAPHAGDATGPVRYCALLPGHPPTEDPGREVVPFPEDQMEALLVAERDRYLRMHHSDGDAVWEHAASVLEDMLRCLRRNRATASRLPAAEA